MLAFCKFLWQTIKEMVDIGDVLCINVGRDSFFGFLIIFAEVGMREFQMSSYASQHIQCPVLVRGMREKLAGSVVASLSFSIVRPV